MLVIHDGVKRTDTARRNALAHVLACAERTTVHGENAVHFEVHVCTHLAADVLCYGYKDRTGQRTAILSLDIVATGNERPDTTCIQ
jgi:hypothetical protein